MEESRIFWFFVLIGVLLVVIAYLQTNLQYVKKYNAQGILENFDSSSTTAASTVTSTATKVVAAPAVPAEPTILSIPQPTNIGIYINGFLDINGNSTTYQISGWEDTYKPSSIEFKFNTGIPPTVMPASGFPTKNIALLGPSSENIAGPSKVLGSFTISFYMQLSNNLKFPTDATGNIMDIELLQVYMQTPYYVIFYVTPNTTNTANININALVGNSVYTWSIASSALVTGNMFTFVVDTTVNSNTPNITFYINYANINITTPPLIVTPSSLYSQNMTLGVSQWLLIKEDI